MRKPYKNGFCLGKFMPFHLGHKLMIDHGAASSETLNVLVSGKQEDFIPLSIREEWLREQYKDDPGVNIVAMIDDVPETTYNEAGTAEDEWFWEMWIERITKAFPGIDAVFTNDEYGDRLAKELGADWLPIDPNRTQIPISGTEIREAPWGEQYLKLPKVVQPYYQRKVAIVGPESTGKSTLARYLAEEFNNNSEAAFVREYGRDISERRNNDLNANDFRAIIAGQQSLLKAAADQTQYVISDTDSFTTYLYSKIYLTPRDPDLEFELLDQARADEFDLYILLYPESHLWVDDGTRTMSDFPARLAFFHEMESFLNITRRNYHVLSLGTKYDDETGGKHFNWELRNHMARNLVWTMLVENAE